MELIARDFKPFFELKPIAPMEPAQKRESKSFVPLPFNRQHTILGQDFRAVAQMEEAKYRATNPTFEESMSPLRQLADAARPFAHKMLKDGMLRAIGVDTDPMGHGPYNDTETPQSLERRQLEGFHTKDAFKSIEKDLETVGELRGGEQDEQVNMTEPKSISQTLSGRDL